MSVRKNFQHTVYASYLGYVTQAIVNNFAPLLFLIFREEYGFSLSQITWMTGLNFIIQLLVDSLSGKFIDKIGYRISILAAHIFAAAGLIGMGILPSLFENAYGGMLLAIVLYAIGGGIIEVLISPIVQACPSENKAAAMSLLHSFYCWGTVAVILLSTVFLSLFGKSCWKILAFLWALLPLFNFFYFSRVPINTLMEANRGMSVKALVKNKIFWIFFILLFASGAAEQAMSQWASAFAESGLHLSKLMGDIAGPCFFSVLMGLSRTFYGKWGEKIDLLKFIKVSVLLCLAAYLLTVFAPLARLSLLGCGLCGLSVGILWPGFFSIATKEMPKGGTAMFALLALAGDLGCFGGPTLVGGLAGFFGDRLKAGLLAAIIFPIILFVFIAFLKNVKRQRP